MYRCRNHWHPESRCDGTAPLKFVNNPVEICPQTVISFVRDAGTQGSHALHNSNPLAHYVMETSRRRTEIHVTRRVHE